MKRRVVITGIGMVTPLGDGVKVSWERLKKGESGIKHISKFDASKIPVKIAGEVREFEPLNYVDKKDIKRFDEFVIYALAASSQAIEDSELMKYSSLDKDKVGVIIGSGIGGIKTIYDNSILFYEKGPRRISPFFIPGAIINMASNVVAMRYGFRGHQLSVVTACATGTNAIGEAYKVVERGEMDVMVAGGSEASVNDFTVSAFWVMRALSTRNDEPERASRPFDKNRDGFVLSEGAGVMILEELGHAIKRGAKIYGEIVGYGSSGDAYHITMPDENGYGAYLCMKRAIDDAGILPEDIDYINAHGTSTPLNDKTETLAIKKLFSEYAYRLPISSNKSMIGHLLGAAGACEAIFTLLSIKDGFIPPTINYEEKDPDCDLDYVPNEGRSAEIRYALSSSYGFGGVNASIVLKRWED
jgi:3-oxoacyl-[acyl-carrier-protein] synthase II